MSIYLGAAQISKYGTLETIEFTEFQSLGFSNGGKLFSHSHRSMSMDLLVYLTATAYHCLRPFSIFNLSWLAEKFLVLLF